MLSSDEIASIIWQLIEGNINRGEPQDVSGAKAMGNIRRDPVFLRALKQKINTCNPIIVADIETLRQALL